jgi:hypothetical protein
MVNAEFFPIPGEEEPMAHTNSTATIDCSMRENEQKQELVFRSTTEKQNEFLDVLAATITTAEPDSPLGAVRKLAREPGSPTLVLVRRLR